MPRATTKTTPAKLAAEICLYGTMTAGSGWLAIIHGRQVGRYLGDGELAAGRSMTEAIWLAADELRAAGVTEGLVRIFMPGGERCADVELGEHIPNFGSLAWKPAPTIMISAAEIERAAERC